MPSVVRLFLRAERSRCPSRSRFANSSRPEKKVDVSNIGQVRTGLLSPTRRAVSRKVLYSIVTIDNRL